ncbi:MAG: hypothetical protein ACRCWQ_00275, partial [Bacilli bacterium]
MMFLMQPEIAKEVWKYVDIVTLVLCGIGVLFIVLIISKMTRGWPQLKKSLIISVFLFATLCSGVLTYTFESNNVLENS